MGEKTAHLYAQFFLHHHCVFTVMVIIRPQVDQAVSLAVVERRRGIIGTAHAQANRFELDRGLARVQQGCRHTHAAVFRQHRQGRHPTRSLSRAQVSTGKPDQLAIHQSF